MGNSASCSSRGTEAAAEAAAVAGVDGSLKSHADDADQAALNTADDTVTTANESQHPQVPLPVASKQEGQAIRRLTTSQEPHVVRIQDLAPPNSSWQMPWDRDDVPDIAGRWKEKKCKHCPWDKTKCTCEVFTYLENCEATFLDGNCPNSFFAAFFHAYNYHQDVLLAPDDIWLLVCMHFSKYVNDNAEELRDKFVSHEGQMKLTVTTYAQTSESEWEEFFDLILPLIAQKTKDDIVEVLQSDFSTTGLVETIISTACIMDSFKKYFSYGRCICLCGIRNLCFLGSTEDWNKLRDKVVKLRTYDFGGKWAQYIDGVESIVDKMIATYLGEVDVNWWNQIMHVEYRSVGSGGQQVTYIDGWILHFFGIYKKCDSDDIPDYYIDVPVKIDNHCTGKKKTVHMVGGFGGVQAVCSDGRKALRPQASMIVYYDPESKEDKEAAEQHFS